MAISVTARFPGSEQPQGRGICSTTGNKKSLHSVAEHSDVEVYASPFPVKFSATKIRIQSRVELIVLAQSGLSGSPQRKKITYNKIGSSVGLRYKLGSDIWISHFTSLDLIFLMCYMRIIIIKNLPCGMCVTTKSLICNL